MTRKHYQMIANAIASSHDGDGEDYQTARWITENLSVDLKQDNPRFDRERFLKACGVDQ